MPRAQLALPIKLPRGSGDPRARLMPPAQHSAPTSIAAAASMIDRAPRIRARIFEFIRGRAIDGATIDEIASALGIPTQTVCGRRWEFEHELGLIRDSGLIRFNASGRKAVVWVAA